MDHDILLEVSLDRDRSSHSGIDSMGNDLALVPLEPSKPSVSIAGGPTITNGERNGLAGLQNMRNTCFTNSALQYLVHTSPLANYFLQDYNEEINVDNPLGMHGELALAFGKLLRKLRLHEDLNCVKQKPYIEMKNSDSRPQSSMVMGVAFQCHIPCQF
ncbi:hypothetical protein K1719_040350 [Acacia pycnantha]|nr:hypothetical protein K1719_040350 [Acacia pycnantha]